MNFTREAAPQDADSAMDNIISFEEYYDPIEYADGDEWEAILRRRRFAAARVRLGKRVPRLAFFAATALTLYILTGRRCRRHAHK